MKGQSFSDLAATMPPVSANATHRSARNRPTAKRHVRSRERTDQIPTPRPAEADFAAIGGELVDTPMWPRHAASWLQGERTPSVDLWTGLTVERRNRIPLPGFVHFEIAPKPGPRTIESSRRPMQTPVGIELPSSGLAPAGWDPRADFRSPEGD